MQINHVYAKCTFVVAWIQMAWWKWKVPDDPWCSVTTSCVLTFPTSFLNLPSCQRRKLPHCQQDTLWTYIHERILKITPISRFRRTPHTSRQVYIRFQAHVRVRMRQTDRLWSCVPKRVRLNLSIRVDLDKTNWKQNCESVDTERSNPWNETYQLWR